VTPDETGRRFSGSITTDEAMALLGVARDELYHRIERRHIPIRFDLRRRAVVLPEAALAELGDDPATGVTAGHPPGARYS